MILRMSNTKGHHGRALAAYLTQVFEQAGQTRNAWAVEHGMNGATISRWETMDPSMDLLRQLAKALNKPLLEVMVIGKYLTAEEAGGLDVQPVEAPSVTRAIDLDSSLSSDNKVALAQIYASLVESGGRVIDTRRPRKRGSSKP